MSKSLLVLIIPLIAVSVVAQPSKSQPKSSARPETNNSATGDAGEKSLIESIKSGDLPLVMKLLEEGADPEATDSEDSTALCWAVRVNQADIVKALLSRGAKIDKEESDGGTALQAAAALGNAEMVKLLLENKANPNHKDKGGHTALMVAGFGALIRRAPKWLASSFLEIAEDDELLNRMGSEHTLVAQLLITAGADVNAQAEDCGQTALMIAAMGGDVELATLLLKNKADVNMKAGEFTALRFAEDFDSPELIQSQLREAEDDEAKQSFLNWIHLTAPGRQEIARMLRKAGAKT